MLRARGEGAETAASRADRQPLRRRERALPAVEAPKFRPTENLRGGYVEDVEGAVAEGFSVVPCENGAMRDDRIGHHDSFHDDARSLVHLVVVPPRRSFDGADFPAKHQRAQRIERIVAPPG